MLPDSYKSRWYVLGGPDGHTPIPEPDMLKAAHWMNTANRTVAKTRLPGGLEISTVFLCLDHADYQGPPMLFETMVFDDDSGGDMVRCSTWTEAEAIHAAMVEKYKGTYLEG